MIAERHVVPDDVVLLNPATLWAIADFVIHDGRDAPLEFRINPPTIARFLARIASVPDGAVVCLKANLRDAFFTTAFPRLRARIVLLTVEGDWSAPGPHLRHLDDERLICWFGQNCDLMMPHPKFVPLPIGVAAPHWPHGNQAALLHARSSMPPIAERPLQAQASFHHTLSHPERMAVWRTLMGQAGIVFTPYRLAPAQLWSDHAHHAFVVSPRGAGLDCHRTWEALALGTIPIVQRSSLDAVFDHFPVAVVQDWREVTPQAMARWRAELAAGFTTDMDRRLTAAHWTARILAAAGRG
ncbi:MAG: hypothetical protein JSS43_13730 [Proteobacteria bacterium]|nr:hypothetical protein [Pseudomonadota bacterium]